MTLRLRPTLSAVYPLVQLPTGDESRGLGAGHVLAFLPIWAQKSFGDWTTYGGGGYWINQGGVGDKDYWFFGGLLQRKVTDRLSIAGEYSIKPPIALMNQTMRDCAQLCSPAYLLAKGRLNLGEVPPFCFREPRPSVHRRRLRRRVRCS